MGDPRAGSIAFGLARSLHLASLKPSQAIGPIE